MAEQKKTWLRLTALLAMILFVAFLHYLTGSEKSPYYGIICRLYYLPIVLAGIWFKLKGGIASALLVSVIFAPHAMFQWGVVPTISLQQYFEVLLFNLTGLVTGILASKLQFERLKTEKSLKDLSESYAKLREQADLIMDIEDQLRQADRLTALGELSAGMAHEIRNPLGSIRGTAEILRDAMPANDRHAEFAAILVDEVDRLNRVVEDFLSFARPGSGEQKSCQISIVLKDILQFCRQQAKKNRVRIHWQEQKLPSVIGDENQFKQVFLNLILNALQAMDQGGDLWIETQVTDCGHVLIHFKDSGPGIPEDDLDKVFNPFLRPKQRHRPWPGDYISYRPKPLWPDRSTESTGGRGRISTDPQTGRSAL